jgi:hypothetical protein
MRRCTRASERRWLELIAWAKEGAKELGIDGMRCGEGRGSHHPFIGPGERRRGVAGGSNDGVNGFNSIEDGGEVKRGITGGGEMMAGHIMTRAASEGGARWPQSTRRNGNGRPTWGRGWR